MKKCSILAIAAALIFSSCSKESIDTPETIIDNSRVFTAECQDLLTKTSIEDGKQVWSAGDRIWISDGVNSEIFTVPESDDNKSRIDISTSTLTGKTVYAVYPAESSNGSVLEGNSYFVIPNTTDGDFASANIMIAKTTTSSLSFRNTTSVIKFTLESADVNRISITSARESSSGTDRDILAGLFYFDYDLQRTWSAGGEDVSSITVNLDGPGTYYVPVFPSSLQAGAKFIFTNSEGQTATRTTSVDNAFNISKFKTISVDAVVSGLEFTNEWKGTGTLGDPYLVTSVEDFIKLTSTTSSFNKDKAFKLTSDIVLPENYVPKSFYGHLEGDNHTITLTSFASGQSRVGLFYSLGTSGTYCGVSNLYVKGDITIEDNSVAYYGAVAAQCSGVVDITNCKSSVDVQITSSALQYAGGVIGYAGGSNGARFVRNSNEGSLSFTTSKSGSSRYFAGVYGYVTGAAVTPTLSYNSGDVTVECLNNGNYGTYVAGVASSNSNTSQISHCYNLGNIIVRTKTTRQNCCIAGGIVNTAKADHSYNAGTVTALYGSSYDQAGYSGGIAGYLQYYGNYSYCYSLDGSSTSLFGYNSNASRDSATECGVFVSSEDGGYVPELDKNLVDLLGNTYFRPGPAPYYYPIRSVDY